MVEDQEMNFEGDHVDAERKNDQASDARSPMLHLLLLLRMVSDIQDGVVQHVRPSF